MKIKAMPVKGDHLNYRVIITSPCGRFGTKIIEGGLDLKAARHEAKKYKELGMVVKIMDMNKKQIV